MKHPMIIITSVTNGWIVTKDCSLFDAVIAGQEQPIWVFNEHKSLNRFLENQGLSVVHEP